MSAYWSTRAGIDTFDRELFRKQVGVAAHLTGVLMSLSAAELAIPEQRGKRVRSRDDQRAANTY
jgi:hypothetical protein